MSIRMVDAVFRSGYPRGGNHLLVLVAMADFADDEGANVRPSMDTLARKVRCSVDQARRVVRDLERDGIVELTANPRGGAPGSTRVYRIRLDRLTPCADAGPTPCIGASPTPCIGASPTPCIGASPTPCIGASPQPETPCMDAADPLHGCTRPLAPMQAKPSLTVNEPKEVVAPRRDQTRALSAPAPGELPCPINEVVELYHECMPLNPRVKVLSEARKKAIRARWKEAAALPCSPFGYATKEEGLAAWREFFETCAESAFLTGRAKPQPGLPPFLAGIDFLMSPSGFTKCLENKYHREAA